MYGNNVILHQIPNQTVILRTNQGSQRNNPQQLSLCIRHIAGIDGFLIHPNTLDFAQRLCNSHIGTQAHKFDCHQAACGIFGIIQKTVDQLSCACIGVSQHLFHQIGRGFLQKVHRIIQKHFVHDIAHLSVGNGLHNMLLCIIIHIGEHLCRNILREQTEDKKLLFRRQFLKIFRNIGRLFLI